MKLNDSAGQEFIN